MRAGGRDPPGSGSEPDPRVLRCEIERGAAVTRMVEIERLDPAPPFDRPPPELLATGIDLASPFRQEKAVRRIHLRARRRSRGITGPLIIREPSQAASAISPSASTSARPSMRSWNLPAGIIDMQRHAWIRRQFPRPSGRVFGLFENGNFPRSDIDRAKHHGAQCAGAPRARAWRWWGCGRRLPVLHPGRKAGQAWRRVASRSISEIRTMIGLPGLAPLRLLAHRSLLYPDSRSRSPARARSASGCACR